MEVGGPFGFSKNRPKRDALYNYQKRGGVHDAATQISPFFRRRSSSLERGRTLRCDVEQVMHLLLTMRVTRFVVEGASVLPVRLVSTGNQRKSRIHFLGVKRGTKKQSQHSIWGSKSEKETHSWRDTLNSGLERAPNCKLAFGP